MPTAGNAGAWKRVHRFAALTCLWLLALSQDCPAASTEIPSAAQQSWWAFQPIKIQPPPQVSDPGHWARTDVDRYILESMAAHEARPLPPAAPATLLRRVYFDLIGLPPSPEDVSAFLANPSRNAFSNVVERLLASPRYGERWGRHWMDVVRYADTAGDNADYPVPEASRYRDYIIDAFNQDKPFDQFIREQLAGDLLLTGATPEHYAERIVATGFLALSRRYATAPFELMHLTIEDTVETTGRAFLGLGLKCARCHDHKFDPVTTRDYYGLYGFFASTRFPYAGSEEFQSKNLPRTGFVPLLPPEQAARPLDENRRRLELLRKELAQLEKAVAEGKTNSQAKTGIETQLTALRTELKRRERSGALPDLPVAYAVWDEKPVDQAIQRQGDPSRPGEVVPRCLPTFLGQGRTLAIPEGSSGRLQLAQWIASRDNPLTARVLVNRLWHHHFGHGLVATPSDFGLRSQPPSHPALLDALADRFIREGWSIKAMHRLILHSAVWQQASPSDTHTPTPTGQSLWVGHERRRLDAESIRDAIMTAAGTLDLERPGPHPFPPIEDWHWTQHNPFKTVYASNHRSVYLMRQRLQRHPYLALFDAPDANQTTEARTSATVPQQALYLMNNPFVREQSDALAHRILATPAPLSASIERAFLLAWSRRPEPPERRQAQAYLERYQRQSIREGMAPSEARQRAWSSYARVLLTANEFFYLD